jgi:hypothetical protein
VKTEDATPRLAEILVQQPGRLGYTGSELDDGQGDQLEALVEPGCLVILSDTHGSRS